MRHPFEVDLRGWWERTETLPNDITHLRKALRRTLEKEGHMISFVVRREPILVDGIPALHGPFRAKVQVRAKSRNMAITRAGRLVRDIAQDYSCRAPRIVIDRERSFARRVWNG